MGWLHIVSDLSIFIAYTAIPVSILIYVKQRGDVPFPLLFWLFCAFIFSCGTTHLLEAVIFWYPLYPRGWWWSISSASRSAWAG